ncbi:MAG: hypothetical protein IT288_06360 [Bdellovibrionales bacterium]|nr:hypothetical protein [Bdellovibrionales bacterium]
MGDLIFLIKIVIATLLIAAVMQTRYENRSIEAHVLSWVGESPIIHPLEQVGEGGAALIRDSWKNLKSVVEAKIKRTEIPGQRELGVKIQRSKEYLSEQAEKAKKKLEEE